MKIFYDTSINKPTKYIDMFPQLLHIKNNIVQSKNNKVKKIYGKIAYKCILGENLNAITVRAAASELPAMSPYQMSSSIRASLVVPLIITTNTAAFDKMLNQIFCNRCQITVAAKLITVT